MPAHMTPEERLALYEAIVRGVKGGMTMARIAEATGRDRATVSAARTDLIEAGIEVIRKAGTHRAEPSPIDRHDADFWRRKATDQQKQMDAMHRVIRELGALDGLKVGRADWIEDPQKTPEGSATFIVHTSDWHIGEVVEPTEINHWNRYDLDVARRRVQRLITAAKVKGRQWTDDTRVDGVLLTMGGDAVSGDIHDELVATNEFASLEQVVAAVDLYNMLVAEMADEYGRVHVVAVPGNHGRTTKKKTAKRYGALSYDTHIARLVARHFDGDDRVTFQIAAGPDASVMLYGRHVLVTHGDNIGTGGGQGFAGPVLPILRGRHKMRLQYQGQTPDLILMGHYHTSAAPPGVLANGSLVGMSEYGFGIRGEVDAPRQWLAVMRSNWGLADRADVQLERPATPPKPRVIASN